MKHQSKGAVWSQCGNKSRFDSEHEASKWAKRKGFKSRVYDCPFCKGFHLTTKT